MSNRQISRNRPDGGRQGNSMYNNRSGGITCVVCCHLIPGEHRRPIFAIGPCDHFVCYHCSAKMRVLCDQNECPICRQDIPEVIFTESPKAKYSDFGDKRRYHFNSKYKIYFETPGCLDAFESLLEEKCKKCKTPLNSVHELQDHLWENHKLLTCELCVQNLKIFSEERKYYNQGQLERHMKHGDPDDKSYQGHPSCQLCNQRYVDNEELNRHLRRDHFYCHFCDTNKIVFYNKYETLNEHFREEHYLCEEGPCKNEQFTAVFRSAIDLQAHKATIHCLTKSEAKHARTLSLDLTFNPTPRAGPRGGLNPQVMATFHEEGRDRGGRRNRDRDRGDRGDRNDRCDRGDRSDRGDRNDRDRDRGDRNHPSIPEDIWMVDAATLGAAAPIQQLPKPEDFPSLGTSSPSESSHSIIRSTNGYPNNSGPPTSAAAAAKAAVTAPPANSQTHNSKAPKKPKHKFSAKVRDAATFGQQDDEEFPALCVFEGASGSRNASSHTSSSANNNISLADAVKLNSKAPQKDDNKNPAISKLTKPSTNSSGRIKNDSKLSNNPDDPLSSQDFTLAQNEFPSLPFKVNGNRKKKKALNILLASLNNPQPNPPPNYTSVRLVNSLTPKENNVNSSNSDGNEKEPNLEADMESLLLAEENFPPLFDKASTSARSSKINKKDSSSKSGLSKSSGATNQSSFSSLARPPPGYEKRNPSKLSTSELSLEAVAKQVIKPTTSSSNSNDSSSISNTNNSNNHSDKPNSNVDSSNISRNSNSRETKQQASSPSNSRTGKRDSTESNVKTNERSSPKTAKPAKQQNGTTRHHESRGNSNFNQFDPDEYSYIFPRDFDERNRKLFDTVQSILKEKFREFDSVSRAFFNDEISPDVYYNKCVEMFRSKLNQVLLDLIVLLPDIRKQKQLLTAHEAYVKQKKGAIPKKTGVWEIKVDSDLDFVVCPLCGQVLSKKDGAEHITTHQAAKS